MFFSILLNTHHIEKRTDLIAQLVDVINTLVNV